MTQFYDDLPREPVFSTLVEARHYRPLPDDWLIGVTDVVDSTGAIAAGRYKSVNMAGATVIAAMTNALAGDSFPFVFGGDGASFAVSGAEEPLARHVLGQTIRFVEDAYGLHLRAALIPVSEARAAGHDVLVARHAASTSVAYAMFRGGGLAYAERAMKQGSHAVARAGAGDIPDLTGLSCRWNPIPARHGVIASLIVLPAMGDTEQFQTVVREILALAEARGEASRPVATPEAIEVRWPPDGTGAEALTRPQWRYAPWLVRLYLYGLVAFQRIIFARDWTVGAFDPARYRRDLVANSDYRKYDDGLRLTLDCTPELADRLEKVLAAAEDGGVIRYGLYRQANAIVTCFVPSAARDDHVHFIDGADGGYAQAARRLKLKLAA